MIKNLNILINPFLITLLLFLIFYFRNHEFVLIALLVFLYFLIIFSEFYSCSKKKLRNEEKQNILIHDVRSFLTGTYHLSILIEKKSADPEIKRLQKIIAESADDLLEKIDKQ